MRENVKRREIQKAAFVILMAFLLLCICGKRQVQAAENCKVVFANAQGVVSTDTYKNWAKTVKKGTTIRLPDARNSGYTNFWVLKTENGIEKYPVGSSYQVTGNVKFLLNRYKNYTLRFYNANNTKEYTNLRIQTYYGAKVALPAVSSPVNFYIRGWADTPNQKWAVYKAKEEVQVSGNKNYYIAGSAMKTIRLMNEKGKLYKTVRILQGKTASFPSVNTKDENMFLGWSRYRGRTQNPDFLAGDQIPTGGNVYYMVVFHASQEVVPSVVQTPQNYRQVYFLGDSRTYGMQRAMGTSTPSNVSFLCRAGVGFSYLRDIIWPELVRQVKSLPLSERKAVIVNFGINDLENVSSYISFLKDTAAPALEKYNCDLYYMSVNPANNAMVADVGGKIRGEKAIASFNTAIYQNLCRGKDAPCTYINTCKWLQMNGWTSRFQNGVRDGVHYSTATYRRIYDVAMRYVNRVS